MRFCPADADTSIEHEMQISTQGGAALLLNPLQSVSPAGDLPAGAHIFPQLPAAAGACGERGGMGMGRASGLFGAI